MEFLVMGFIVFFDYAILKWKLEKKRYGDFTLDLGMLLIVMTFFHSSTALLMVGMVAQFLMSLYLYISPPKLFIGSGTGKGSKFINKIASKIEAKSVRPAL